MKDHITAAELAERWGVGMGHLANERSKKKGLPYSVMRGKVYYKISDIEKLEKPTEYKAN